MRTWLAAVAVAVIAACGGGGGGEDGELPAGFEVNATRTDGGGPVVSCPSTPSWRAWFEDVSSTGATLTPNGASGPGAWVWGAPMRVDGAWVVGCEANTGSVTVSSVFTFADAGGGVIDHVGTFNADGSAACASSYRIDSIVEDLDGP